MSFGPAHRLAFAAVLVLAWCALGATTGDGGRPPEATPLPAAGAKGLSFVGRSACVDCHASEAARWQGSHHDQAMQPATNATVLGAFDGRTFELNGERWQFAREGERFVVRWSPPGAKPHTFDVAYTFGVAPLQQYLIAASGGRLQSLSVVWDVEAKQWIHLQPDEPVAPDDALHWQGRYQTWNGMCADCHSTRLDRGYDAQADVFETTWAEIDVSCEACHGPGSLHVERTRARAAGQPVAATAGDGLLVDLSNGPAREQVDVCGRCHARRRAVSPRFEHGGSLFDHYVPTTLDAGLYEPDGQILDEVYVYGSFTQSAMFVAGVRCTDCHDAHSLELREDGDAVCMQCHGGAGTERFPGMPVGGYDTPAHHHHVEGQPGSACVDCHMPARTYMQVDPRRDHRMGVPRPDLSVRLGTPNACTGCHTDESDAWAAKQAKAWWGAPAKRPRDFAALFHDARQGDPATLEGLGAWVDRAGDSPAVRATAVELAGRFGRAGAPIVDRALRDPEPWVRTTAASATLGWPLEARAARVVPLLDDPVRSVRVEAARSLAPFEAGGLEPGDRQRLGRALDELVTALEATADHPGNRLNLAVVMQQRGDLERAEREYRMALELDPRFLPARLNLVHLLDAEGRGGEAEDLLRAGLADDPDAGDLHYALGLLVAQARDASGATRLPEAARHLERAAQLLPEHPRAWYNLGLARQQLGDVAGARAALASARRLSPEDPEVLQAVAIFHAQQGEWATVRDISRVWLQLMPGDPSARSLLLRAERELAAEGAR